MIFGTADDDVSPFKVVERKMRIRRVFISRLKPVGWNGVTQMRAYLEEKGVKVDTAQSYSSFCLELDHCTWKTVLDPNL